MATVGPPTSLPGDPTWEIAYLFPHQGMWTSDEYLALSTNHLVELSDGFLEVLPMPTEQHQLLVLFLYRTLFAFVMPRQLGTVLAAPLRVRLWEKKYREPDLVFMLTQNSSRRGNQYWRGADLVMEVVSEDDPERDLVRKREEYATAGIQEYWVVDPRDQTILVLSFDSSSGSYAVAGQYAVGETARSVLLESFAVDVTQAFSQR